MLFEKRHQVLRADFFLAFDQEGDVDRQRTRHGYPCPARLDEGHQLTLVVLRAARDDNLATVGVINRAGSHGQVGGGTHRIPPADIRHRVRRTLSAGQVPHLGAFDQRVGLSPELHLAELAEQPAVGDDAVVSRQRAGEHRGLGRAGHGG